MMTNQVIFITGTFNPITIAHVQLGVIARKMYPDAKIIYVPSSLTFMRDWKKVDSNFLTDEDRLLLVKESVRGIEDCVVSDCEIKGMSDGRTYNTLELFKEEFLKKRSDCDEGAFEFYLVMGTDKLGEIYYWYKSEQLFSENKILVFDRDGKSLDDCIAQLEGEAKQFLTRHSNQFLQIDNDVKYMEISSTQVRDLINKGNLEEARKYIPKCVYEFFTHKPA